jgi:hypothetical protein
LTDEAAERPLQRAGNWLHAALARLTGRKSQSP